MRVFASRYLVAFLMTSSSTSTSSDREMLVDPGSATALFSVTVPSNTNDSLVSGNNAGEESSSSTEKQAWLESSLSAAAALPSSTVPVPESAAQARDAAVSAKEDNPNQPLLLPPAGPNDALIPRIALGESIRFEEMGPIIINSDGTTRRIDNWDQMTKREQQVTWRRIRQRNEERRQKLLLEQQQVQQPQQQDQDGTSTDL